MVGSIVKHRLHPNYRIRCHRPFQDRFLKPFFYRREIILGHCAPYYLLFKGVSRFQIPAGLKCHLHMAVLPVAAGLFLILVFYVGFLADGFPEGNLRPAQFNVYFVTFQKLADYYFQVLVANAVNQCLAVGAVIFCPQCQVLLHQLLQRL